MKKILSLSKKNFFWDNREFKFWSSYADIQSKCIKFSENTRFKKCALRIISKFRCSTRWKRYENMWRKKKEEKNENENENENKNENKKLEYIVEKKIDSKVWKLKNESEKEKKNENENENENNDDDDDNDKIE